MSIYTRAGDNGRSSTLTRTSLSKDSPIFDTLGNIDELSSMLGVAKAVAGKDIAAVIEELQVSLSALCEELAGGKKFATDVEIKKLEKSIDSMSAALPENKNFVIPGKTELGAYLHTARTVARRAERSAITAKQRGGITKEFTAYLNRLSDFLFTLAALSELGTSTTAKTVAYSDKTDGFCALAVKLSEKIREYARSQGVRVVVAVCDGGANLVSVQRDDDAYIASIDIAINKAYTSASLKMPTKEVGELARPDGPLYGIQHTNNGKIVIFGGGEPIIKGGAVVGALGVSGGTLEQDTAIALYASELFKKEM